MSRIGVTGTVELITRDISTGKILDWYRGPNLVVSAGLDAIADRVRGNTAVGGASSYALGTDSTLPVSGQTALIAEAYRNTLTQTFVSAGELRMTLVLGATQGNGITFTEGGAFNEQNTMFCRVVFPPKAKTNLQELTIIHSIVFAAS